MTTPLHGGNELDLNKLEALARAATPGPWQWIDNMAGDTTKMAEIRSRDNKMICDFGDSDDQFPSEGTEPNDEDVQFIIGCSPATVLRLIDLARRTSPAATGGALDLSATGLLKLWQQSQDDATDTMPAPFQFARKLLAARPAATDQSEDSPLTRSVYGSLEELEAERARREARASLPPQGSALLEPVEPQNVSDERKSFDAYWNGLDSAGATDAEIEMCEYAAWQAWQARPRHCLALPLSAYPAGTTYASPVSALPKQGDERAAVPRYKLTPGIDREWLAPAEDGPWCRWDHVAPYLAAAPVAQAQVEVAPMPVGSVLRAGQILAAERRSNMTDDEALRFGRAIEGMTLQAAREGGQQPVASIGDDPAYRQRVHSVRWATTGAEAAAADAALITHIDAKLVVAGSAVDAVDAARWRWLRLAINRDDTWPQDVANATTGDALEAAIDAAMSAAQPSKEGCDA